MKLFALLLIIVVISQVLAYKTPQSIEADRVWQVQCRIKLRGTFKLTHVQNTNDQVKVLNRSKTLYEKEQECEASDPLQSSAQEHSKAYTEMATLLTTEKSTKTEEFVTNIAAEETALAGFQTTADGQLAEEGEVTAEAQEELDGAKANIAKLIQQRNAYLNGENPEVGYNLFVEDENNSIELPNMCRYRLNAAQLLDLGVRGKGMADNWLFAWDEAVWQSVEGVVSVIDPTAEAYKTLLANGLSYTNMPPLAMEQFIKFYGTVLESTDKAETANQGHVTPEQCTEPQEDEKTNQILKKEKTTPRLRNEKLTLNTKTTKADMNYSAEADDTAFATYRDNLILSTVLFGSDRQLVNWLEFWVYMCSQGEIPEEKEYMVPADNETAQAMYATFQNNKIFSLLKPVPTPPARKSLRHNRRMEKHAKRSLHHHSHRK